MQEIHPGSVFGRRGRGGMNKVRMELSKREGRERGACMQRIHPDSRGCVWEDGGEGGGMNKVRMKLRRREGRETLSGERDEKEDERRDEEIGHRFGIRRKVRFGKEVGKGWKEHQ
jgi:hypothetical protein